MMSDTQNGAIKQVLLDMLAESRSLLQTFIGTLTDVDKSSQGTLTKWSIKDELSHVTLWQKYQTTRFKSFLRGETMPAYEDYQTLNEQNFEATKDLSWSQIEMNLYSTLDDLIATTQLLSEEQLTGPHPIRPQDRLYSSLLGNGYSHVVEHVSRVYLAKGDVMQATAVQERSIERLSKLDDRSHAAGIYNLACFYTVMGDKEKALMALPKAFKLDSGLVEWSKQDTDLDALRNEPDFQALYRA